MAKTGKLSNVEKMAIQGGLGVGQNVEEIAKALDRTLKSVNKYVEGELDDIHSTIASVALETGEEPKKAAEPLVDYEPVVEKNRRFAVAQAEDIAKAYPEQDTVYAEDIASKDIMVNTYKKLRTAGLTENDANRVIHSALTWGAKNGQKYKSSDLLYTACIKRMNASHFITKVTQGGKEGVAVMSGAASARMDEARKTANKPMSRSARGAVYSSRTGEMLE